MAMSQVSKKKAADSENSELVPRLPVTLKQPQSIVHIKHTITLQQYKYWILLLQEYKEQYAARITPDPDGFYCMRMEKLASLIGYTPKKAELWADLKALKNETITLNILRKDSGKEKYGAGFVSEWAVSNSYVRFKLPSALEALMRGEDSSMNMFLLLNWNIFNTFGGKYEAIIYKLCRDFLGTTRTPYMTVQEFRDYMGLQNTEYAQFMRLGQKVITEPVGRINSSPDSDITVQPEYQREGRKVVGLHFKVEMKKIAVDTTSSNQEKTPTQLDASSPFQHAKATITPQLQAQYRTQRTDEEIALCIERVNEYAARVEATGRQANYGKLYRTAIAEGWHQDLREQKTRESAVAKRKDVEREQQAQLQIAEAEREKANNIDREAAWNWFSGLSEAEQAEVERQYEASLPAATQAIFKNRGRNAMPFRIFLREKMPR